MNLQNILKNAYGELYEAEQRLKILREDLELLESSIDPKSSIVDDGNELTYAEARKPIFGINDRGEKQ